MRAIAIERLQTADGATTYAFRYQWADGTLSEWCPAHPGTVIPEIGAAVHRG